MESILHYTMVNELEKLINYIFALALEHKWDKIDLHLDAIDPIESDPEIIIAWLRSTYRYRNHLKNWHNLLDRTHKAFNDLGVSSDLLIGLM